MKNLIVAGIGTEVGKTVSKENQALFAGPQLTGFILDHIFVNDRIDVFTHGIDIARASGEFPSDHFPVIADLFFR